MSIVFRVDASIKMGTGHVMRCLTLANALTQEGEGCYFICRPHKGNLIQYIEDCGYKALTLPKPLLSFSPNADNSLSSYGKWLGADMPDDANQTIEECEKNNIYDVSLLVIDHYALDWRWETKLRAYVKQIMVIDDLANRQHDCDFLVDQTFNRDKQDYDQFTPKYCKILTGSQYSLLRPEFSEWRQRSLDRRSNTEFKRLLITMGGTDPQNCTGQILHSLEQCNQLPKNTEIIVILGATSPYIEEVRKLALSMSVTVDVKVGVSNMAEVMAYSDIAIGAAGSTTWERCCLGLPSILLVLDFNQQTIASNLHNKKVAIIIDSINMLCDFAINRMLEEKNCYSKNSADICDGLGVDRLLKHIL